ncbi:MAG: autotransporter assembly complex family protein [Rhizobiaceae bacterium]
MAYRIRATGGGTAAGPAFARRVAPFVLAAIAALAHANAASAFELFGIHLWGEEEEQQVEVVDPLRYSVTIEVKGGDSSIRSAMEDASSLYNDRERPVSGSLGLMAKARGDREQLVAALYQEARYDGVVEVSIAGQSLDELPPDAEFRNEPVPVTISVDPGAVFRLGAVALEGDAADLIPSDYGLVAGGDAGSETILKAEGEMVTRLKEEGRPLARVSDRKIVADHDTSTLDVTLVLEAGPIAGYGATTVEGTETVDAEFTAEMAGLEPGRTYSPEELRKARERLLTLEVFSSVSVREADALDANGAIPINVEVSERKHRYFGVGVTVSNTEGFGIEGYWGHRNLFGRAERLRIEGSIARIGDTTQFGKLNYNAAILFEKPGVLGPTSKFFTNTRGVFEHPDAYDKFSFRTGAGLEYGFLDDHTVSGELAVEWSKVDDVFGSRRHLLVSIPLQYVFDNRDNRLNPTTGFRALAFVEPTYDLLTKSSFVKLRAEASAYQSISSDDRFVVAGRVATGSIMGAGLAAVPADRRFYAGGGGSVRGYAYQGIGPRNAAGEPTGGLSYVEASVEMRIGVTDTFGVVPFIDMGSVSVTPTPDFSNFRAGAGIGIRYLTPFGPLRVDAAMPLNRGPYDPRFGIYAGIGQAF